MKYCSLNGIQQSMNRAGSLYNNAPMERFYNTFKCEYFSQYIFCDTGSLLMLVANAIIKVDH